MKLFGYILIFLLLVCKAHSSFSQKKDLQQYIVKDSMYIQGEVIPLKTGTEIVFQKNKQDERVILSAGDISEFGFGGSVYESLTTKTGQAFFAKIVTGKILLYKGQFLYGLKVGSALFFFNEDDYRTVIGQAIEFQGDDRSLAKLAYKKKDLSYFIQICNKGDCNIDNIPYAKFGVYGGCNFLQFTSSFDSEVQLKNNIASPSLGIFYDFPLYRPQSLFLTTELNWSFSKPFLFSESSGNSMTYSMGLMVTSINSIISTKWLFTNNKIKPYLKAGALISYTHVKSENGIIGTHEDGNDIVISRGEIATSGTVLLGYSAGIGVEVPYRNRKKIHMELKYLNALDGELKSFDLSFSGLSIVAGFNF